MSIFRLLHDAAGIAINMSCLQYSVVQVSRYTCAMLCRSFPDDLKNHPNLHDGIICQDNSTSHTSAREAPSGFEGYDGGCCKPLTRQVVWKRGPVYLAYFVIVWFGHPNARMIHKSQWASVTERENSWTPTPFTRMNQKTSRIPCDPRA